MVKLVSEQCTKVALAIVGHKVVHKLTNCLIDTQAFLSGENEELAEL